MREIVVRRCRRCGVKFMQYAKPKKGRASTGSSAYILHSYCPACRWRNRRAFHMCDPRFAGIGGHGVLDVETVRQKIARAAK